MTNSQGVIEKSQFIFETDDKGRINSDEDKALIAIKNWSRTKTSNENKSYEQLHFKKGHRAKWYSPNIVMFLKTDLPAHSNISYTLCDEIFEYIWQKDQYGVPDRDECQSKTTKNSDKNQKNLAVSQCVAELIWAYPDILQCDPDKGAYAHCVCRRECRGRKKLFENEIAVYVAKQHGKWVIDGAAQVPDQFMPFTLLSKN